MVLKPCLSQFIMIKNIATIKNQATIHLLQQCLGVRHAELFPFGH